MENNIKTLWSALSRAQGKMSEPKLDKTNPHFKSKYASLASIWEAARGPLTSEGLSIIQGLETGADGKLILATKLMHESGEGIAFYCPILTQANDMQKLGSAITYARRYSLNSMLGTSGEEDDDGNAAAGKATGGEKQDSGKSQAIERLPNQTTPHQALATTSQDTTTSEAPPKEETIDMARKGRLIAVMNQHGWEIPDILAHIRETFDFHSLGDITSNTYGFIIEHVTKNPKSKASK